MRTSELIHLTGSSVVASKNYMYGIFRIACPYTKGKKPIAHWSLLLPGVRYNTMNSKFACRPLPVPDVKLYLIYFIYTCLLTEVIIMRLWLRTVLYFSGTDVNYTSWFLCQYSLTPSSSRGWLQQTRRFFRTALTCSGLKSLSAMFSSTRLSSVSHLFPPCSLQMPSYVL